MYKAIPTRRTFLAWALGALLTGLSLTCIGPVGVSTVAMAQTDPQTDPLPSWNDGAVKTSIIDFVTSVTKEGEPDFIPVEERIATFDNDGNLWSEQPYYFQLAFMFDRVKAMAKDHPEWKEQQPFKAVLEGNAEALLAGGEKGLEQLMAATHAGITVAEFSAAVREWVETARHPRFDKLYTDLVFQPMLELLTYLRENDFKTFIVSGGGIDFMRPWVEKAYGIPPEQVIGSSGKTVFKFNGDVPVLEKQGAVEFVDDGAGKPVGINRFIGRRPVFAAGNSDGDMQMLEWTTVGTLPNQGPRLGMIVHHTDAEREWAYDRHSHIGKLDKALDAASQRGWLVVDMKRDWKVIYPFEK